jgi:FdhE protein
MVLDQWLREHPYLAQIADLRAAIDSTLAELPTLNALIPKWDDYVQDFGRGVPLLYSTACEADLESAATFLSTFIGHLSTRPLPGRFNGDISDLDADLRISPDAPARTVEWLLGGNEFVPRNPGLLRWLGWTALARFFAPVVMAFSRWRDDEQWLRNYCPTCGSPPCMGQLVGVDPGRLRFLSCGCCNTRWRYRRTGCPFCENVDDHKLAILSVQGQSGLRIDYCQTCRGYLKTYNGQGEESTLLADWTSLHLDILARDRGLLSLAASLYVL